MHIGKQLLAFAENVALEKVDDLAKLLVGKSSEIILWASRICMQHDKEHQSI